MPANHPAAVRAAQEASQKISAQALPPPLQLRRPRRQVEHGDGHRNLQLDEKIEWGLFYEMFVN